ncbi:MAG: ribonuclease III [Clostridia bacterium]|nr:ribonuclease III [Clostridia bacterium]
MTEQTALEGLEESIGYSFKNRELLKTALTHSSYANEKNLHFFNERLEFLGDSVIGFITAEFLFGKKKNSPEGELTRLRAANVCEAALYGFACQISLGKYLYLGRGEEMGGGRERPSLVSDAFEALVAAIYLDGGMAEAKKFVLRFISEAETEEPEFVDYKTILQEIVQRNPDSTLVYALTAQSGPAHARVFEVSVMLDSNAIAVGTGTSKKRAEQAAAKEALKLFGLDEPRA